MAHLEGTIRKYTTGKLPSHSRTADLGEHYAGLSKATMLSVLTAAGLLKDGKPTKRATAAGVVDECQRAPLWNLDMLASYLSTNAGMRPTRIYANQKLPSPAANEEERWGALTTVATYFNVSAQQVGKWMDDLGLRTEAGEPSARAADENLGKVITTPTKRYGKHRTYTQWDVVAVVRLLHEAGHPLDFDYEASLRGKGKNTDVTVTSIDARVQSFLESFVPAYNAGDASCQHLVSKTPKPVLKRAETRLNKPGFFTRGTYREKFRA